MVKVFWLPLGHSCTANEGPVRIQYKCLVSIYVFPEMKLLFPKKNYNLRSPSSYTHISARDLYISRAVYSAAGKYEDRSWEYISRSQTHGCGNWDWGHTIPWKGIHIWDFPCSVPSAKDTETLRGYNTAFIFDENERFKRDYHKILTKCFII